MRSLSTEMYEGVVRTLIKILRWFESLDITVSENEQITLSWPWVFLPANVSLLLVYLTTTYQLQRMMCKEAVLAYFTALHQNLSGGTDKPRITSIKVACHRSTIWTWHLPNAKGVLTITLLCSVHCLRTGLQNNMQPYDINIWKNLKYYDHILAS